MDDSHPGFSVLPDHLLQQLSTKTDTLLLIFNPAQQNFTYLSTHLGNLLGLELSHIQKQPALLYDKIFPDDQENVLKELNQLSEKKCIEADFRLILHDRAIRWFHAKACLLDEDVERGSYVAAVAEDIHIRKELELNLISTHAHKDVALQILGHDLRAPIGTISSAVALIKNSLKPGEAKELTPYLEIISTTCGKALTLIAEVIRSVFWETQQSRPKEVSVNLAELIDNQLKAFRLLQKEHKEFILQSTADAVYLNCDPVRLQLIIENLLSNAYKFTRKGGRITVNIQEDKAHVLLSIQDDGIGIPAPLAPLIFQRFSTARRQGMQGEKSTGLGLHIVKTLVEQLRGKIWFESQEGKGTTFFVSLPR